MVTRPDKVDVVIVGAGAAGSLYAAKLAAAGKSVVVLEAGPPWHEGDLVSSQIWARRLKWGGPPVEFHGNHRGFSHNLNTGWGFGGAALHHYGTWPRLPAAAFHLRSRHGKGLDWPLGYDDLRPHYDAVQREVGVCGDAAQEPWRPPGEDYPMPPMPTFAQGEILRRGFTTLGLATAPLPAAITTTWYNNRPPCLYDGWCDAGCPIGALGNPLATYLTAAVDAGAILIPHAQVTRLLPQGRDRLKGVAYVNADGDSVEQTAAVVILAASAIQNPRLMLASGVGNGNGLVGRYFMLDLVALVYGLMAEETEPYMGVSAGQLMHRAVPGDDDGGRPFGGYQWQIAPALKPNDIFGIAISRADLFGDALHRFMTTAARHMANIVGMVEQLPQAHNRITLSGAADRFGVPRARIEHQVDDDARALWQHCIEQGKAVMAAAGAREVWTGPFNAGHLVGGTIMSADPRHGVTDSFGRCHEVANLVIAGSGLFPTSGGVSPTFSLLALAHRSAQHMLTHWGEYAA